MGKVFESRLRALEVAARALAKRIAELEEQIRNCDETAAKWLRGSEGAKQRIAELEEKVKQRTEEAQAHADRANELQRKVDSLKRRLADHLIEA